MCDYSDYIVVKETISFLAATANENYLAERKVAFKNKVPLRSRISKINSTLIDNADNLDIVILMYNLLEYNQNCPMISGNLWNYHRDQIDNINDNDSDGKLFKYKTKVIGKTLERPA